MSCLGSIPSECTYITGRSSRIPVSPSSIFFSVVCSSLNDVPLTMYQPILARYDSECICLKRPQTFRVLYIEILMKRRKKTIRKPTTVLSVSYIRRYDLTFVLLFNTSALIYLQWHHNYRHGFKLGSPSNPLQR